MSTVLDYLKESGYPVVSPVKYTAENYQEMTKRFTPMVIEYWVEGDKRTSRAWVRTSIYEELSNTHREVYRKVSIGIFVVYEIPNDMDIDMEELESAVADMPEPLSTRITYTTQIKISQPVVLDPRLAIQAYKEKGIKAITATSSSYLDVSVATIFLAEGNDIAELEPLTTVAIRDAATKVLQAFQNDKRLIDDQTHIGNIMNFALDVLYSYFTSKATTPPAA